MQLVSMYVDPFDSDHASAHYIFMRWQTATPVGAAGMGLDYSFGCTKSGHQFTWLFNGCQ